MASLVVVDLVVVGERGGRLAAGGVLYDFDARAHRARDTLEPFHQLKLAPHPHLALHDESPRGKTISNMVNQCKPGHLSGAI